MRNKRKIPFAIRNLALAVALTTAGTQAGAVLVADGKLGTNALGGPTSGAAAAAAEGYTSGWSIGFQDDKGNLIGNGQLWFGTDLSGAQYLYFQLPFDYVDNCYNTSAAACPGWGGGHTFKDLLNSDSMGANPNFTWTNAAAGGATNAARIDYIADCSDGLGCNAAGYKSGGVGFPVTGQGAAGTNGGGAKWSQMDSALTGSAASILEIATSLEYNLEKFGTGFETNSSTDPNWVKEVGYELKFAAGTFDPVKWANPNVQAVNDGKGNITIQVPGLLTLGDPHVSPPKVTFGGYTSPCMIGNPLCTPVPEPSTPLLLLGGLAGMAWYARRRRESSQVVAQRASSPS